MEQNPEITPKVPEKIEAFNTILNETNGEKLSKYYRNMDEFFGVNQDIILIDPHYLLTNEPHLCTGDSCTFDTVEEAYEDKEDTEDITDLEAEEE